MLLANQGADVIKVEPPGGDPIRKGGSGSPGLSAYLANLNRNKRSIVIDLKTDDGVGIVRHLAAQADVFVEKKIPDRWELVDELPRNSAGKVIKAQLRGLFG